MGLLGNILNLGVDVIRLPLSVVGDVADTLEGDKPENTKENLKDIVDDIL